MASPDQSKGALTKSDPTQLAQDRLSPLNSSQGKQPATNWRLQQPQSSHPRQKSPLRTSQSSLGPSALQTPLETYRGNRSLDEYSPVMENGCYIFDRILKSGQVSKRMRKTKGWKKVFLVLRPGLISVYKTKEEDALLNDINTSDIAAVVLLERPKEKGKFVFGVYTPSRSYHFRTTSKDEAEEWVVLIRGETQIDQDEKTVTQGTAGPKLHVLAAECSSENLSRNRDGAISPDSFSIGTYPGRKDSCKESATEYGSYSDFSDAPPLSIRKSSSSARGSASAAAVRNSISGPVPAIGARPVAVRNVSGGSSINVAHDPERVIWNGYLYCLKKKRGVKSWRKAWMVLRENRLAFYPDTKEYEPFLIIDVSQIINALEIDPVSDRKQCCLQIITEKKNYRFCACGEDDLAKCLGSLKSVLVRKKSENPKAKAPSASTELPK